MQRGRGYIYTWNSPPDEWRTHLDGLECKYIIAGQEHAPTTGRLHLQGYILFNTVKSTGQIRRLLPGCHIELARGTSQQCIAYCSKEDPNPYERGTRPLSNREKGDVEKERWEKIWTQAKRGDIEDIEPSARVRFYSTILKIQRDFMPAVVRLPGPCGLWIRGAAGCGKTRTVLDTFPDAYPKPRSKWWDGYQGEPVVYCDDLSVFHVALGDELKLWADAYPFIGEIKGGSKKIRPTKFIVTSQYSIEEIWQDEQTRAALLRRFIIKEKVLGEELIII